jgi:hypothetical protein
LKIVTTDSAIPPHTPPTSNQPHRPIARSSQINSRAGKKRIRSIGHLTGEFSHFFFSTIELKIVTTDPALPLHTPPTSNQPHRAIAVSSLMNSPAAKKESGPLLTSLVSSPILFFYFQLFN